MLRWLLQLFASFTGRGAAVRKPVVEEVEPRILYSADANPLLWGGIDPNATAIVAPVASGVAAPVVDAAQQQQQQRREIIFVDAAVEDAQTLIDGLIAARPRDTSIELVELRAGADGLRQIGDVLGNERDLDAVHIISHGGPGQLRLGDAIIDAAQLQARAVEVEAWRSALKADAELLLHGCDVAEGSAGQDLVNDLARLTGVDVAQAAASRHEVVFIDTQIDGWQQLVDDLNARRDAATTIDIVRLDAGQDGITQISAWLQGRQGIDAIQIYSHGVDGAVELGSAWLNAFSLEARTGEIGQWRSALSADADILLYGCDVAAGGQGQGFVDRLAEITGADVAASRDATGSALRGGNWMLEYASGSVEAANALSASVQQSFTELLVITVGNTSSADTTSAGASSLTWSHTVVSGSNGVLIVEIASKARNATVTSVTYGGTALTFLGASTYSGGDDTRAEMWILKAPATGTANIVINMSATSAFAAGATNFYGVDQTTPTGSVAAASNNNNAPSVTVASATGELVIDTLAVRSAANGTGTVGAGQTQLFQRSTGGGGSDQFVSGSREAGAPSVTMSWTLGSNDEHAIVAVSLRQAAATGNVIVTPTSGLVTTEAGGTAQFSVVLSQAPTANVTIAVSSSDTTEGTVSTSLLTFTSANWNVAQTVTVTGAGDTLDDGNIAFTIVTGAAVSSDAAYSGLAVSDVALSNTDDDTFNTVVVTNASDTVNGNTTSIAALMASNGGDGISLREAITAANNTANGVGGADRIHFNIALTDANHLYYRNNAVAGTFSAPVATTLADAAITDFDADYLAGTARSWFRITLGTADLNVTQAVIIDGSTQAGYDANKGPIIEINAAGVTASDPNAITLTTGASTIRGLAIHGAGDNAIEVDTGAAGSVIVGNYIGLDVSGTRALGNTSAGAYGALAIKASSVVVGGTTAADRNVIAGTQGYGIELYNSSTGATVHGNYIGVGANGSTALANALGGIRVHEGSANNLIGGVVAGQRNIIAGNGGDGVWIDNTAGNGNAVLGNAIHGNSDVNIDLGATGPMVNDNGDADSGANNLQNAPTLASAVTNGSSSITVAGTFGSNASSFYRIEFFASPTVQATGRGEGQTYLGFVNVSTDSTGEASFSAVLSANVAPGQYISATATRSNAAFTTFTDTSEFSVAIVASSSATYTALLSGGGVAMDVRGMRTNGAFTGGTSTPTLNIAGVPASATVVKAWLVVSMFDYGAIDTGFTLNGTSVTAVPVSSSRDEGWGANAVVSVRADVSALVTGNGAYTLGGATALPSDSYVGATLVVVYADGSSTQQNLVTVSDRVDSVLDRTTAIGVSFNNGAALPGAVIGGSLHLASLDGQDNLGEAAITFQASSAGSPTSIIAANSFGSAQGGGKRTTVNISALINQADTGATLSQAGTASTDYLYFPMWATVINVDTPPVNTVPGARTVAEDTAAAIGGVSVNDANGNLSNVRLTVLNGAVNVSLAGGATISAGANSSSTLTLSGSQTQINAALSSLSYQGAANYNGADTLTVLSTDALGQSDSDTVAITVTAVNDAPVITSNGGGTTAAVSVAENTSAVTTVTSTDIDGGAAVYSIVGGADAARFTINASTGALTFVAAPNYEAPTDSGANNVYDVTVQVSDGAGGTDMQAIAVTVTPTNDNAPVITSNGGGATATANVNENQTTVTTVAATDADLPAQTITYSIIGGADSALFTINASTGALLFVSGRNYEAPSDAGADNVYDVIVQADDGAGGADTQAIAVSVMPVNEASPVITSNGGGTTAAISRAENTTAVTTVTATDSDLPAPTLTYSISGGADAVRFAINSSSGALTFIAAPDHEAPADAGANNVYDVTVTVSDGTRSDTQAIAVTVTPVNDNAPVIGSNGGGATASVNVAENSSAVTTVTASDADLPAQTLSYSISGGADAALFSVNATTGVLVFNSAPNFETPTDAGANNVYDVIVQASDGAGLTDTQAIAVTVSNVNEAPVITSGAAVNAAENQTSVTTVTSSDVDGGAPVYSIAGGADAARFTINATTGVLTFNSAPNFEAPADAGANNVYDVTVQAADGNGGTATQAIAVTVTNVNEAPVITSAAAVSVAENQTAVMTVASSDVDGGAPAYSLVAGGDGARFTINSGTGALSFIAAPDYETPTDGGANNVYDVTVQVSDGNGGVSTQAIAVTVSDVSSTLVVTTTADSNDTGLGASFNAEQLNASRGSDGAVSLREALIAANNTSNPYDAISFNIAGAGVHTITIGAAALPTITGTVLIDGWSQGGFAGTPLIELSGAYAGSGVEGLTLGAGSDGSTIRGLIINRFTGNGIDIYGSGYHTLQGLWIGLDATGTAAAANVENGVYATASVGNLIGGTTVGERNVIAGNGYRGIHFVDVDGSTIAGNYIGTDVSGSADINGSASALNQSGIVLSTGSDGNLIGGTTAAARNVVSGNNHFGVEFQFGSQNNRLQGNTIGANAAGNAALGNSDGGVSLWGAGTGNLIGGGAAGAGNVISGNALGVLVSNGSTGAVIQGNLIGLGADGVTALGNTLNGIQIDGAATNTLVGTNGDGANDSGERNVIAANGADGIFIGGAGVTGTVVAGNFIGTDATGLIARGNEDGIVLDNTSGMVIGGSAASQRNVIAGNSGEGIEVYASSNAWIAGNHVGLGADGNTALANSGGGVFLHGGSNNITIGTNLDGNNDAGEGNVISGNGLHGITLNASSNNTIRGNLIGLDAGGTQDRGNANDGIHLFDSASNTIGGVSAAARNVISGNDGYGIVLGGTAATGNVVRGNFIGTNAAGNAAVGNGESGIGVFGGARGNSIGGTAAGAGNVISGNGNDGIVIADVGTMANAVQGNIIGLNAAQTAAIGNTNQGLWIGDGASGNTIGGSVAGAGNVIGGNINAGIEFSGIGTSGNVVAGNFIGTDASGSGSGSFGNGSGVAIFAGASNNLIGGVLAGAGNLIANNLMHGVVIVGSSSGNAVLRNSLRNNGGLGIDLGWDGVTPNDAGDADGGANGLQNFPLLSSVNTTGGNTTIVGTVNSTANTTLRIELFSSPAGDASGHGEAQTVLGFTTVTTDASGNANFAVVLSGVSVTAGHAVSATATPDLGGGNHGSTSEFSANVTATDNAPAINVGTINGNTSEAGGSASFSVVLNTAPTADVTIAVSSSNTLEGTVNTSLLTFTSANWNIAQTVTVTGIDESIVDGNHAYTVVLGSASSADAAYNGLNAADVILANTDNDAQSTIVVTTASDAADGDTSSLYNLLANSGADGRISLREAIIAANNSANGGGGADRIHFAIAGSGVHTIDLAASLPAITDAVILDASSDDSFAVNGSRPAIVLDGNGTAFNGLALADGADGSTVRGFVIRDFSDAGIWVAPNADNITIAGNYIGALDANGGDAGAGEVNGTVGLWIEGSNTLIGGTTVADRNLISGNTSAGVGIGGGSNNVVRGNYIGVQADGSTALANYGGLYAQTSSGLIVGGTAAGAGNVVSGNANYGLLFEASVSGGLIQGNLIGLAAGGITAVGNGTVGIQLDGGGHLVGGTVAGARNVISGNGGNGIDLGGSGNVVEGNLIGLTAAGNADLGNAGSGIEVLGVNHRIGGTSALQRNVISGNDYSGIYVDVGSDNLQVVGNFIGTDASGTTAIGNSVDGVRFASAAGSNNARIGGSGAGEANIVAGNTGSGVRVTGNNHSVVGNSIGIGAGGATLGNSGAGVTVSSGSGHSIRQNGIANNGGLGIDLGGDGVTANDAGDADSGPNALQNFPVLSSASSSGGNTTIAGAINSTANTTLRIEFFSSPSGDSSGFGEGAVYLGFVNVTTDASGNAAFAPVLGGVSVSAGHVISATASVDLGGGNYGSTSEFSANVVCQAPPVNTVPGAQSVNEDSVLAISGVSVADPDGNLASVRLTVGSGTLAVGLAGGASISAGANGSASLTLAGTQAQINAALASIAYQGTTDFNGSDTLTVLSTDALGATDSDTVAITVNPVNDAPVITSNGGGNSAAVSAAENTNAVTAVASTDVDAQTPSYTISGGADAARFTIDSVTGVLSFVAAPDFEVPADTNADNVYEVTVQVADGNGGFDTQALTVTVSDVASTLLVTTTSDAADSGISAGNSAHTAEWLNANRGADAAISLREAIIAANNTAGTDTISFDLAGAGVQTINVTAALPTITGTVIIDGWSEPDFAGTPVVELNGAAAGAGADGLWFTAGSSGSTVRGLIINRFASDGLFIDGASSLTVQGNWLGLASGGGAAAGNGERGIFAVNGGGHQITGNVIAGNGAHGILLGGVNNSVVAGNLIGTDASGTADINGAAFNPAGSGILLIGSSNNLIGGTTVAARNVISGNNHFGVELGGGTQNNLVQGNFIGTDITGANALANGTSGVGFWSAGTGNVLGGSQAGAGNIISGNAGSGVLVAGASNGVVIQGNTIGLSVDGNTVLANGESGVDVRSANTLIGTDANGVNDAGERNVISGNVQNGVAIGNAATGTVVAGNTIGTNESGTVARGNGWNGVSVSGGATNNTIGGTAAGAGNLISGNTDSGITIVDSGTSGNLVLGNVIGLNAAQNAVIGNVGQGLWIGVGASGNTVGGTVAGAGNVISGNGFAGVVMWGTGTDGNRVLGNSIGTDASGTASFGNGRGVVVVAGASNTVVGGTAAGAGNLIANNSGDGVTIDADSSGTAVLGNSIRGNGDLGIDQDNDGVTSNDAGDADGGANGLQNFPVIATANSISGDTTITGTINSTPNTALRLEFFSAPTGDASGYGEGQSYLGFLNVTTDAAGNASFVALLNGVTVSAGHAVSATATVDLGSGNYGDTSEFSAHVACTNNSAPVNSVPGAQTVNEDTLLAITGLAVGDAQGNLASVQLSVGQGTLAVNLSGGATISSGANGSATLTLAGTQAQINSALATLGYQGNLNYFGGDTLTVVSTDSLGTSDSDTVAITVSAVNDAPLITSTGAVTVAENQTGVVTVTSSDVDGGTGVYSILGGADGARFTIDPATGVLTFNSAPNFEAPGDAGGNNVYDVTVQVADGNGGTSTQAIAVTVSNVNEAPVITSAANVNAAENQTAVMTVTSSDVDGPSPVYTIVGGSDAALFTIDTSTGVLTFNAAPNFEAPADAGADNVYDVTVQVSDGALTDTQTLAVTVTNVNEAPVITSGAAVSVAENQTGAVTVTSSDVDGGSPVYTIVGGADAALFMIDPTTGVLTFNAAPDFEAPADAGADNNYDVTVQVADGNGGTATQAIAVTVSNVNEAPVITSAGAVSVAENQTAVLTTTSSDVDGGAPVYTIVGGADAALFTIDPTTGALRFNAAPNFEAPVDAGANNVYDLTVQVADGNGGFATQAIAVTVSNVNEAPSITSNGGGASAGITIAENQTAVAVVTSADVDGGAAQYSIAGGADAARFTIDAASGSLSFRSAPDFEAPSDTDRDNVYQLVVAVADGNGGTDLQSIAVAVTGINEAPGNIAPSAVSLAEQAPAGTVVAIVTASDPDAGDLFTFTLVNDGAGRFVIDPASGRLQVAPGAVLDFESSPSHTLIVRVTDAQGLRTEQTIVITLLDEFETQPEVTPPNLTPPPAPAPTPLAPPAEAAIVPVVSVVSEGRDRNADREPATTASGGTAVDLTDSAQDGSARWQPQRGRSPNDGGPVLVASVSFAVDGGVGDGWSQGALDGLLLPASEATLPRFGLFALRGSSIETDTDDDTLHTAGRGADEAVQAALGDPVRVASATLTAGFVWWLTRSGGLLTSILMGIPAWRHVDLLPVLAPARDDEDEEDSTDSQNDEAEPSRRDSQIDDLFSNTSRMFGESRYMS